MTTWQGDEVTIDKMTTDELTVDKTTDVKMTVDKMMVDEITVDKMKCFRKFMLFLTENECSTKVGQLTVDFQICQITCQQLARFLCPLAFIKTQF